MKKFVIFLAGVGIGATGCWLGVKKYYEELATEEIESVKEYYKQAHEYGDEVKGNHKENYHDYSSDEEGFINYHDFYKKEEKQEEPEPEQKSVPYPISTDEFVNNDQYEKITVIYDADNLTFENEEGAIVLNGKNLIGMNFELSGNPVVYVRNETIETDYEVIVKSEKGDEEEY